MTTKEIQALVCKTEILKNNIPCENVNHLFPHECDVLSILASGYVAEYEIKISRSDFRKDGQKRKWLYFNNLINKWIPNYFYYVCKEGLIKENEIPEFAGLIHIVDNSVIVVKKAVLIHKIKHDRVKITNKFLRIYSQRAYLGYCRLTYDNK